MSKQKIDTRSNNELRKIILQYFYDRNHNAKSARSDKSGVAAKISIVKKDLKAAHELKPNQVWANLTYLISQGWVAKEEVTKTVKLRTGVDIPQTTIYYQISAPGIDKIEGEGEFTLNKFQGIKIEATGQNIITVGDGNQVNAKFEEVGQSLSEFKSAIIESAEIDDSAKLDAVADIETIQSQLAKSEPSPGILTNAWGSLKEFAGTYGLVEYSEKIAGLIAPFLG